MVTMYTLELENLNASAAPGKNLEVNYPQINNLNLKIHTKTRYVYFVRRGRKEASFEALTYSHWILTR